MQSVYVGKMPTLSKALRKLMPNWLWASAAALRERILRTYFEPYITTRTFGKRQLRVWIPDPTARAWYDRDWDTPMEIELLTSGKLARGARVFDVGAHHAVVALQI